MGFTEIIVLSAIALLVIGPKQLPEVARVVGRMLNEFKRATGDITSSLTNVKKEAQGFADQTKSYMHKQKSEFEKKMKESMGPDFTSDDSLHSDDQESGLGIHHHADDEIEGHQEQFDLESLEEEGSRGESDLASTEPELADTDKTKKGQ